MLLFARWVERNHWSINGYQNTATGFTDDFSQLEFRESLRGVTCSNEASTMF